MMLEMWQKLLSPDCLTLREDAAGCNASDVAAVARLRKHHDADLVRIALDLAAARRKAQRKFPDKADTLVADSVGVEQATSQCVAEHKAKRFAGLEVTDLCCGIGGDAMSLPMARAVDSDPVRAWMAQCNAGCKADVADVTQLPLTGVPYHIDPSRRDGARRTHSYDDYQPGPDYLDALMAACPDGAVKLGPGVDLERFEGKGEVELISEGGSLVQAVLWTGNLARDVSRSATLLSGGAEGVTLSGEAVEPDDAQPMRYLLAVSPALERAGLVGLLPWPTIHPALGLLTSDEPIDDPWVTTYELIEQMPPRKVRSWLRANDGGIITVKTRGKACDPDKVQRDLRGKGDTAYTVFILRFGTQIEALITLPQSPRGCGG